MKGPTPIYDIANDFSEKTTRAVFLTGKAGTGKTTFLRQLKEHTRKQIAVVAPTGVAAINAGGVTLHSFFQLPLTPFVPTAEGRLNLVRKIKMTTIRRKVMQQLEILVIDEISMVRADILDAVDTVLRHFRYRRNEPFGGVQVIYIGDLYQLPPVVVADEWEVIAPYYKSPFFFDSHVVQQQPPIYIELDKIFRQKNPEFVQLLNEVRNDNLSADGLRLLQSRYDPDFQLAEHPDYIFLTTHNAMASRINRDEMAKLSGKSFFYQAQISGDFPEKIYPNDAELELKVNAKVMFISNDKKYPHRYYNGKIGCITHLDDKHIHILCEGESKDIVVERELWENIRYNVNKETGQIEENTLGTYSQFPLRLAWAITIHKSQGLTFDKAIIDAAYSFSSGQVYVALSRCRSLEGLVLTSPIRATSLEVEKSVLEYSQQKRPTEDLRNELVAAEREYDDLAVQSVFDFNFSTGQALHLQNFIRKNAEHFNTEARAHADELCAAIVSIRSVADKFRIQIHQICTSENTNLKERLKAAEKYFAPQIDSVMELASDTPAEVFDFDLAKEYKEELKMLYTELALKKHLIGNVKRHTTAESLHKLRDKFQVPPFSLHLSDAFQSRAFAAKSKKKATKEDSKEPKTPTHLQTLKLYMENHDIAATAAARGFVASTIENHLAKCVAEGLLPMEELVPKEFQTAIGELLDAGMGVSDIFSTLEGNVTYGQIKAVKLVKETKKE